MNRRQLPPPPPGAVPSPGPAPSLHGRDVDHFGFGPPPRLTHSRRGPRGRRCVRADLADGRDRRAVPRWSALGDAGARRAVSRRAPIERYEPAAAADDGAAEAVDGSPRGGRAVVVRTRVRRRRRSRSSGRSRRSDPNSRSPTSRFRNLVSRNDRVSRSSAPPELRLATRPPAMGRVARHLRVDRRPPFGAQAVDRRAATPLSSAAATGGEELDEQRTALVGPHADSRRDPVVQHGPVEQVETAAGGTSLGIGGTVRRGVRAGALTIAPAHIAHGSSVTTRVQSSSRQ